MYSRAASPRIPPAAYRGPVTEPDAVDRILEQWRDQRPDLDPSPMGVIGRLHRVGARLNALLLPVFREHGLGEGEFDVLATLRRSGIDHALTPSELMSSMMVTSGATTKRIDRLERAGLVRRSPSTQDGRVRLVSLTEAGLRLVDTAVAQHLANEDRLLAGLEPDQRATLADLLRRLGQTLPD